MTADEWNIHDLYELCVQRAGVMAGFLGGFAGGDASHLREDFSGRGGVARAWCAAGQRHTAVCVDIDEQALEEGRRLAASEGVGERLRWVRADLRGGHIAGVGADVVFAGNFSIGYFHSRASLLAYVRGVAESLVPGGAFVCDTYGGAGAYALGGAARTRITAGGDVVRYVWAHEEADPRTGMVTNSISFRVLRGGDVVADFPRAFVYHWRLWSLPELREVFEECGFDEPRIYADVEGAGRDGGVEGAGSVGGVAPIAHSEELGEDWTVLLAARRAKGVQKR
jgi:SAM-dependent methyltransferase